MDSKQDPKISCSESLNMWQPRQNASVPAGYDQFNESQTKTSSSMSRAYNDLINKIHFQIMHVPSTSTSQNPSFTNQQSSPSQNHFFNSSYQTSYMSPSVNQTNDIKGVTKDFESLTFNSPRKNNPSIKSYDELYNKQLLDTISNPSVPSFHYQNADHHSQLRNQLFGSAQHNSSMPSVTSMCSSLITENKKSRKKKPIRRSVRNFEFSLIEENLSNVEVNLETLKSIGIGPLCPPNKNSLFPLVIKINQLCEYLSMLADERCQVESKILGQQFNSKKNYIVPYGKSLANQIIFVQRCLFIEHSMAIGFIKSYETYLDKEVKENTNVLLNELRLKTGKLSCFEALRIYQKHGELIQGDANRIEELELLLSELMKYVRHCCMMFFIMKHYHILKKRQITVSVGRQRRNNFIG